MFEVFLERNIKKSTDGKRAVKAKIRKAAKAIKAGSQSIRKC